MKSLISLFIYALLGTSTLITTQANELYLTNNSTQDFWIITYNNHIMIPSKVKKWLRSGEQVSVPNNSTGEWDNASGHTRIYGMGAPYIEVYQNESDGENPDLVIGTFSMHVDLTHKTENYFSIIFVSCNYTPNRQPTNSVNFVQGLPIGVYQWFDCRDSRIQNW